MNQFQTPVYTTSQRRFINQVSAVDYNKQTTHRTEAGRLPPSGSGAACCNTRRTGFGISSSQVSLSQVATSMSRSIKTILSQGNDRGSPQDFISKKHFRLGGLAASEWKRSVRAVRDTPVADYSAPGVNTTRRVAYRPPIAVSPFLLALSVSYFKQTLWLCGQL
jgi:hypothetical protein